MGNFASLLDSAILTRNFSFTAPDILPFVRIQWLYEGYTCFTHRRSIYAALLLHGLRPSSLVIGKSCRHKDMAVRHVVQRELHAHVCATSRPVPRVSAQNAASPGNAVSPLRGPAPVHYFSAPRFWVFSGNRL